MDRGPKIHGQGGLKSMDREALKSMDRGPKIHGQGGQKSMVRGA